MGNQTLVPHVVKDGRGPRGGDAGVGQAQDAVEGCVVQEGAGLRLAQAEDLVGVRDACDLSGETTLLTIGLRPPSSAWCQRRARSVLAHSVEDPASGRQAGRTGEGLSPGTLVILLEATIAADLQMATVCASV